MSEDRKTITLEIDVIRKHEILAILIHFYNNKYVLDDIYADFRKLILYFLKIDQRIGVKTVESQNISNSCELQSSLTNYNTVQSVFKFKYNFKTIFMGYFYDDQLNLIKANICHHKRDKVYYDNEKNDLKVKFIRDQNRLITKFKFFDQYYDLISSKLNIRNIDINTIFRFRPYIDEIINFQKNKTFEPIYDLCRYSNNLKRHKTYSLKNFLKIRKKNDIVIDLKFGSFKSQYIKINYPDIDSFYDIFTPVFEKLGGIKALEGLVLRQRLMEE